MPILVNPLVCTGDADDLVIDDDDNPDSNGDDDEIIEPGETIEFLPFIDNVSDYSAEKTQGQLYNLNGYSNINIWNGEQGISGTVYSYSWWNYAFGVPSPIAAHQEHMQPQFDFVFDYNYTETYQFTLHTIFSGGFYVFEGSNDLTLLRFATQFVFNSGSPSLSVDDINSDIYVDIYPNPSNGKITINGKNIQQIEIFDITGKSIYQNTFAKNTNTIQSLDLNNKPNGIYLVKIITNEGTAIRKIIVE